MTRLKQSLSLILAVLGFALVAHAADKPAVIRISNPGVGVGNRPVVGGSSWSVVNLRGLLEDEFKPDGTIRIRLLATRAASSTPSATG